MIRDAARDADMDVDMDRVTVDTDVPTMATTRGAEEVTLTSREIPLTEVLVLPLPRGHKSSKMICKSPRPWFHTRRITIKAINRILAHKGGMAAVMAYTLDVVGGDRHYICVMCMNLYIRVTYTNVKE